METENLNIINQIQSPEIGFLQSIDPSLLQNVVLGILALLIPVGISVLQMYTDKEKKNNIELLVLLLKYRNSNFSVHE